MLLLQEAREDGTPGSRILMGLEPGSILEALTRR
jgi:hypothetical protein